LVAAAPFAGDGWAQAQTQAGGRLAATAYGPLPVEATLTIDYRDDTDLNNRLRAVFESELTKRGHRVSDRGDLTLTFETLVEEKLSADRPATVMGRGGSESGAEASFQFRLPLNKPKPEVGGRRYSLNVVVARRNGNPLWVASAVAVAAKGERFAAQRSMVVALVETLGQTVERRPIQIE
jgi:hypothetical protein